MAAGSEGTSLREKCTKRYVQNAARNAKCKMAIAVTFGFHSHEKLLKLKPDVIVHKPEELLEAVK